MKLYEEIYTSGEEPFRIKIYQGGNDLLTDHPDNLPVWLEASGKASFLLSPAGICIEFKLESKELSYSRRGKSMTFSRP